jgi:hypothetical protein
MEGFVLTRSGLFNWFCGVALCFAAPVYASELDREVTFHIKPQSLEGALLQFSRQADVQFAFASDLILNAPVQGIDGKLAVSAALVILLRGSGLSYTVIGTNTVTVTRTATTSPPHLDYIYPASSAQQGSKDPR